MIEISQPQVVLKDAKAYLQNYVSIDGEKSLLWFCVDDSYKDFLCYERSDAYVIAVLNFAMRNHHDIKCEAPITEDLFYNIDKCLIDALCKYNPNFYRTHIFAPIASDKLPNAGAVGTGISCGVDSLHVLASQTNLQFKHHNITHLCFNNVGSHGEGENAQKLYLDRLENPKKFSDEYGYKFVQSNSNLMDVIHQSHYKTHTYSSLFAVYCLQKLYSIYYYASSGYSFKEFHLDDRATDSCGSYETLLLPLLSTKSLRVYSAGEDLRRMDKLKIVVNYEPSYKYLNVCLSEGKNCSICEKCIRTMLGLYALGKLDLYAKVFDVSYFKSHKKWYFSKLVFYKTIGSHDYIEIYECLKNEIDFTCYIKAIPSVVTYYAAHYIHNKFLKSLLKKVFVKNNDTNSK